MSITGTNRVSTDVGIDNHRSNVKSLKRQTTLEYWDSGFAGDD
ncbi:hypothetical protein [Parahalioglobus pacificus]|nr:hypothetical protein [Halioglobus pacificus]